MTCTLLAVARASVTDNADIWGWAGVLLEPAQFVRVNRRTNRVCKLDPSVSFSHYSPQPYALIPKNLVQ